MNKSVTSDSDVDSEASLFSSLTPVFSAVGGISRFDGAVGHCCRVPGTDTTTDCSLSPPHDGQSGPGFKTLTVKRDGAVFEELQSGGNDPSKSCVRGTDSETERYCIL